MAPPTATQIKEDIVATHIKEDKENDPSGIGYSKGLEKLTLTGSKDGLKYPFYAPTWPRELNYPALTPFEHKDPGHNASPNLERLWKDVKIRNDLTPAIGTELIGPQVSKLTKEQNEDLALFVAQRGLVVFRDQDFADQDPQSLLKWGEQFGRLHIHPTSGHPAKAPEFHLVYRDVDENEREEYFKSRTSSVAWHSDVTYEEQPPGLTALYILEKPPVGGDTLWVSQTKAYERLSPLFRERLHGLKAIHSGYEQAQGALDRDGHVRRQPVKNAHPIIRTHPVTKQKALFVNPQFTREIVGLKKEESDAILNFLYDHIAKSADIQARVRWAPGTLVLFDNRVSAHSALLDYEEGTRRHAARITPQAERPFETPFEK